MTTVDIAALMLRTLVGLTLVAHAYNHMFGPDGLAGTARWFDSMGLRPPRVHAFASGVGELICGLALAVGLFTAIAAAFVVGTMTVAAVVAHRHNGFFVFKDGYEYVLVLAGVSICIPLLGPGVASIDRILGIDSAMSGALGSLLAAGGGFAGGAMVLVCCWRPASVKSPEGV